MEWVAQKIPNAIRRNAKATENSKPDTDVFPIHPNVTKARCSVEEEQNSSKDVYIHPAHLLPQIPLPYFTDDPQDLR